MSDDNLYILITKNREQVTINIIGAVWYIATACLASVYNKLISKLGANSNKSMSKKAGRHTACGLKIILQLNHKVNLTHNYLYSISFFLFSGQYKLLCRG